MSGDRNESHNMRSGDTPMLAGRSLKDAMSTR